MADNSDEHFKQFAVDLEHLLVKYGTIDDLYELQRCQLTTLIDLEADFRGTLQKNKEGLKVYEEFIHFICSIKRNILDARPYFRERQKLFTKEISGVFKKKEAAGLFPFRINYRFILFVMGARKWGKKSKIQTLFNKITALRTEILEINIPLGISRARVFYSKTPRSHLSYMDLIQIAQEGTISGIDKYTPGDDGIVIPRIFRSTVMGRQGGYHIQNYSETLLHFFPVDARKIYRANKAVRKLENEIDFEALAKTVNLDVAGACITTPNEIADLMAAASCLSLDLKPTPNEEVKDNSLVGQWDVAPDTVRPDVQFENEEAMDAMSVAFSKLTIFERKFLRMKGLNFHDKSI